MSPVCVCVYYYVCVVNVCMSVYVCMLACVFVCVLVCVYVCMCVCALIYRCVLVVCVSEFCSYTYEKIRNELQSLVPMIIYLYDSYLCAT